MARELVLLNFPEFAGIAMVFTEIHPDITKDAAQ
jgi:hypothetical protein